MREIHTRTIREINRRKDDGDNTKNREINTRKDDGDTYKKKQGDIAIQERMVDHKKKRSLEIHGE